MVITSALHAEGAGFLIFLYCFKKKKNNSNSNKQELQCNGHTWWIFGLICFNMIIPVHLSKGFLVFKQRKAENKRSSSTEVMLTILAYKLLFSKGFKFQMF